MRIDPARGPTILEPQALGPVGADNQIGCCQATLLVICVYFTGILTAIQVDAADDYGTRFSEKPISSTRDFVTRANVSIPTG